MMFTALDADMLAGAFPEALRADAIKAANSVLRRLHNKQWTERLEIRIDGEAIHLPARLYFASDRPLDELAAYPKLMAECLQSRSNDGFQRQLALRELLTDIRPWSAPFVMALIGEYVIEILDDIYAALSPPVSDALAAFISASPTFWDKTRQRVASYWNVYYRADFLRSDYVGFKIIDALNATARASAYQTG